MRLPALYPITDRALAGGRSHEAIVRLLVAGGASLVQVREKAMADRDLADAVRACVAVHGARVVVDDRPDVALVAGAEGVHLGEEDLPAAAARALMGPSALIGVSTHAVADAVAACALPVDYVALGPVFETRTAGVRRAPLGVGAVREAARSATRPLVAIGGIDLARAADVLAAGAAAVAVISDLMTAPDIPARVRAYLSLRGGSR
jgi:thiamine-phosphate pyrophosphorylase